MHSQRHHCPPPESDLPTRIPPAGDDAGDLRVIGLAQVPSPPAFDHDGILTDYVVLRRKLSG